MVWDKSGANQKMKLTGAALRVDKASGSTAPAGELTRWATKDTSMRISFDVDDTLVCDPSVPTEPFASWWRRWWYPELLRRGTRSLMQELHAGGHQLWIYTTSYRSAHYLRGWFRDFGVPICGVVNQQRHERVVGRQGPSKYPPAFGIDLHIDDSEGVAEEGKRHRFGVVVVSPTDLQWGIRILEAVESRVQPRAG